MSEYFSKVRDYLFELECTIVSENEEEEVFIVEDEDAGIKNMVIALADPILIMEQYLFEVKKDDAKIYKSLLQKNRDVIHGAFCLDETGKKLVFRDTLQLENLDLNELEGSINSLSLLLTEYSEDIIRFSK